MEGKKSHYGTSTDSPNHRDPFTGDIRPTSINDIALGAKVADALAHIDFVIDTGGADVAGRGIPMVGAGSGGAVVGFFPF
ncbi:MAG: hypothetical protein R6T87_03035, partial [Marinobacter sp.]